MSTSQKQFLSEVTEGKKIPAGTLAYFRQRLQNRVHNLLLNEFLRLSDQGKITKAELARRVGRPNPSQITRWLSSSSNCSLDTISDLLLAMGVEPELGVREVERSVTRNYDGPDFLLDAERDATIKKMTERPPTPVPKAPTPNARKDDRQEAPYDNVRKMLAYA
jgi:hypothetical protein